MYCKPTVQGSTAVLQYLARYVHRVAITDARILSVTADHVTFSYKDAQAHTWRRMMLPGDEFLRRFLQHVLPTGFHKVRYYGFWSPAARAMRIRLQDTLGSTRRAPTPNDESVPPILPPTPRPCPQCAGGVLRLDRRLAPARALSVIPP